jgi:hypothetical protein
MRVWAETTEGKNTIKRSKRIRDIILLINNLQYLSTRTTNLKEPIPSRQPYSLDFSHERRMLP